MVTRAWAGVVPRTGDRPPPLHAADAAVRDPAWDAADDAALVAACQRGHRSAFDVLVERHRRPVYQVCYRFVATHEDASDLAQEVFVRAYRSLARFRNQASFSTWLYRIAVNTSLNRVGARRLRTEDLGGRDPIDHATEAPDARLLRQATAAEVRSAIARLPRTQRATLVLRVYHDLPHREIAEILGSSVGAVKANFFHALKNLGKLLR